MNIAEQIKYFKKISRKEATLDDLKAYFTLLIQSNFSDPKDCPPITFKEDKEETYGSHSRETNTININSKLLNKVADGDMIIFAKLISTCGHELTHYFQFATDYVDYIKDHDEELCNKIKNDLHKTNNLSYFTKAFVEACNKNSMMYRIILATVHDIPSLSSFLDKYADSSELEEEIGYSYYLQLAYEEDARLGGLSFFESIISEYRTHLMKHPDEEMWEYLLVYSDLLNVQKYSFEEAKRQFYPAFDEFKKIFTNISDNQIFEMSKILLDERDSSSKTVRELQSAAFYNLLLDTYIELQIAEADPIQRQIFFMTGLHHYFITDMEKDKNKFAPANLYGAKVLNQLLLCDIPMEQKQGFGSTICKNFIQTYDDKTFNKKDNFITLLYLNDIISGKQMDAMFKKLLNADRIFEACNILHFDDLNNNILYSDKDIPDISKCVEIRFNLLSKHIFKILKKGSEDDEFFKEALSQLMDIYSNSTVCYLKVNDKKAKEKMEFIRNKSDSIRNKVQEEYFAFKEKNRAKIEGPLPDKLSY